MFCRQYAFWSEAFDCVSISINLDMMCKQKWNMNFVSDSQVVYMWIVDRQEFIVETDGNNSYWETFRWNHPNATFPSVSLSGIDFHGSKCMFWFECWRYFSILRLHYFLSQIWIRNKTRVQALVMPETRKNGKTELTLLALLQPFVVCKSHPFRNECKSTLFGAFVSRMFDGETKISKKQLNLCCAHSKRKHTDLIDDFKILQMVFWCGIGLGFLETSQP